jgi:type I restriction enzyme, S subunit
MKAKLMDWKNVKLGALIESLDSGVSVNGEDSPASPNEKGVLKISSVTYGQFQPNENKRIIQTDVARARINPKKDRIIMSRANTPELVGASVYVSDDHPNLFLPDKLWQFEPSPANPFSMKWLSYVLSSDVYRRLLSDLASGSSKSMQNITKGDVLELELPLPPLPEQKVIADLLSTWDKAIEKTEKLIAAKDMLLKGISNELLFGIRNVDGHLNSLNKGHLFDFSSDWSYLRIKDIATEISIRNEDSNAVVLSCSKYDGFINSLDYFGKKVFSDDTSNYKVVKKWQFGYPANHVEEGSIGMLEHCEKGIVSPIYVVFETDSKKVIPPFLYKVLKTNIFKHIYRLNTSSSVDRRGSLRWTEFSLLKVALPSIEEQQNIVSVLEIYETELSVLKSMVGKYKEQKRGLMQKLLTGEWRVKGLK